jgi:hypothetical protein
METRREPRAEYAVGRMAAARFTLITEGCLRIEYSPRGRFVDAPTLLAACRDPENIASRAGPDLPLPDPVIMEDRRGVPAFTLSTNRLTLTFSPDGSGLSPSTLSARIRGPFAPGGPDGEEAEWRPGSRQSQNLGGTLATLDGIRGPVPLGEGLLSRDGWYLIDDSANHLLVDGWVRPREMEAGACDWYLFAYGQDYGSALRSLTALSGAVPLPRRYLLGSWYSRFWPHTSDEFRQIVRDYESHGLPLDVMVLDMDWHRDGWTGWSWNRQLLPDAEDLMRDLHRLGLAVTLNLHPADGVGPHEDGYGDFMRAIGRDPASGETVPFDAGNRLYMEALFERIHRPLEEPTEAGADFWWVDWQQDKFTRSIPGLTNLQWLNRLYFEHTRKVGGGTRARRGVSFSRWAGDAAERRWGDHRHPIHFSGDSHTGWDMLSFQVPFTSTAGNVGCFFWSHDIGGHFGPRMEETTARWVQFGALSAALRLHSARTGVLDRRPWTYQQRFFESMRGAFQLRAMLMPYIYSEVHRSCAESRSLLRPMYLDHPRRPRAYTQPQQYLLGENLLAAPIVRAGVGPRCVGTQAVWFPPVETRESGSGAEPAAWRNAQSGERFLEGDEAIVAAAIDEIPLFVREGVPLPMAPDTPARRGSNGDGAASLHVRLWPTVRPETFHYELVEDDGLSEDPFGIRTARTPIIAAWTESPRRKGAARLELVIRATAGSFSGQPERRRYVVEVGGVAELLHAELNGGHLSGEIDSHRAGGLLSIGLPEHSMREEVRVCIDVLPADAARLNVATVARRFGEAFGRSLAGSPDVEPAAALRRAVIAESRSGAGDHAATALAVGAGIGLVACGDEYRLCDTFGWIDEARARVEVVDQVDGRTETRSEQQLQLAAEPGGRSRGATIKLPSELLTTPPLGVRASRWLHAEIRIDGQPLAFSGRVATAIAAIPPSAWRVMGPFPWDWRLAIDEQVFSPEVDGGRGLRWRDWHEAANGSWLSWVHASEPRPEDKWPIDLRRSLNASSGLAYARTIITSSRRQQVRFIADSGDKLEIWLNRKKVFSQNGFETEAALEGGATVKLLQGRNTVLVKCASGGGGWGFSLAIDGQNPVGADNDPDLGMVAALPSFW